LKLAEDALAEKTAECEKLTIASKEPNFVRANTKGYKTAPREREEGAHRVIIDTDPGIDDMMALFLALSCPKLQVEGITIVMGNNADMKQMAKNACYALTVCDQGSVIQKEHTWDGEGSLGLSYGPVAEDGFSADGAMVIDDSDSEIPFSVNQMLIEEARTHLL